MGSRRVNRRSSPPIPKGELDAGRCLGGGLGAARPLPTRRTQRTRQDRILRLLKPALARHAHLDARRVLPLLEARQSPEMPPVRLGPDRGGMVCRGVAIRACHPCLPRMHEDGALNKGRAQGLAFASPLPWRRVLLIGWRCYRGAGSAYSVA